MSNISRPSPLKQQQQQRGYFKLFLLYNCFLKFSQLQSLPAWQLSRIPLWRLENVKESFHLLPMTDNDDKWQKGSVP